MTRFIKQGLLVLAALGGGTLALFVTTRDEPPPDISDIAETRPPVADADNAFLGLLAVASEVAARAEKDPALLAALTDASPAADRDPSGVLAATAATRDLQAAWLAAIARRASLAPAHRDPDNPPYPFSDLHRLGRLGTLWAEALADHSPREAMLLDLQSIRAAHHITDSHDTLIVYCYGVANSQLAATHLREIAAHLPISAALARELVAGIEAARSADTSFAAILRNEIHFSANQVLTINLKKDFAQWTEMGFSPAPRGAEWFFKPHQTARWSIEELRLCLAQLDGRPLIAISVPEIDRGSPAILWGLPHPDNAAGRYLASIKIVSMEALLAIRLKHASTLSALQAWLAVRAHQSDHGELPPDLASLVPAYLPRVPTDFADNRPIRYSPAARAVWSVGSAGYEVTSADSEPDAGEIDYRLPAD